jgi:hypothetical protein
VWVGWTGAAPAAARAEPPKLTAASHSPDEGDFPGLLEHHDSFRRFRFDASLESAGELPVMPLS